MGFKTLIKEKRKEYNMTQEGFANAIGVDKQTISNWETGKYTPNTKDNEIIDGISDTLKISKKDIIISLTELDNTQEYKKQIHYPFLPDELMDIKLSEKEIEILFAIEYLNKIGNSERLTYEDYIKILGSGRNVLSTKKYIDNILDLVNLDILLNIIRKNNLKEFNIQSLSEKDIYLIVKPYINAFCKIASNSNDSALKYIKITNNKRCYGKNEVEISETKTNMLIFSDEIEYDYSRRYVESKNIMNSTIFENYFVQVETVTEKDLAEYETKLAIYNEEFQSWERKMVEIRKLQDLYDAEKYPDLPEPKKPEMPKEKLCYKKNYKGILLEKFLTKMQNEEKINSDFAENAKLELKPYLDKEIFVFGTLISNDNNGYLFKSIYFNGIIIDHLWVYDIEEKLKIGNTYELNGIVNIYTKEVNEKSVKNYGIKVTEIKEI